jgi:hypothetical protein
LNPWCRHREQRWVKQRAGSYSIAKPDIHLERDASVFKARKEFDTDTFVFLLLLDLLDANSLREENETVVCN